MVSLIFFAGIATTFYYMIRLSKLGLTSCYSLIRSYFNAKKYLTWSGTNDEEHQRYYAVIYGASNKAGNAYAHYLAAEGFNLILIERNIEPLNLLEIQLNHTNADIVVMKFAPDKFDEDSLNRTLSTAKNVPVKIFVNCKNSKRPPFPSQT
mgnify:CR=1 FL=1